MQNDAEKYLFPGDEIVQAICINFKPIFAKLLLENELQDSTESQIYRLPIAPIIGDFLAEHLTLETLKVQKNKIRELTSLDSKMLELDSKDQTNYSFQQVFYCLRLSPSGLIQASDHIVTRKNYESIENLAREYENGLLHSYAMCIFCFQNETVVNGDHVSVMSSLSDKLLAFGRGKNVYELWSKFFKHFKEEKIVNQSVVEIHKIFTTKLMRLKKDTEITSIEKLNEYYGILYNAFGLKNMPLDHLKQFIHSNANNFYAGKVEDFKKILPGLYEILSKNRPLKELPKLKELFLPAFFENISPDFLPVTDDDRIIALSFPPAEIRTHWVKYIYIVDTEKKVKIFPEMTSGKRKGQRISHSQLANWGPVKAAGEMYFAKINGKWHCVQINNGSGHYEPDAEGSLQTAKEAITGALSGTKIHYDQTAGIPVRNVLLPGVPAHSFLNETNGI
ncbi:MAG: hypothetical protein V4591_05295 [Bdellovibrionota bacterium]